MARCILMTGGGGGVMSEDTTVSAEDVLEGKTYLGSDTDDEIGVGTMPNNDSFSSTLNCGQSILIPKGYHTGSGKITANSLASQTPGNATAASMLNGRTGWVNGKKITGTIPSQGAATFSPSKGTTKTIITSGKYTSGDIKLAGFNMPDPSKLAKGYTYTLYGQSVTGTAETHIPASTRYFIKNGQPAEGGSWIHINSRDASYTVVDNYLKLSTTRWVYDSSTYNSFIRIATSNTVFDLSDIKDKYSHVYYDYYVDQAGYSNSSSDEVLVTISFSRDQTTQYTGNTLLRETFIKTEMGGSWKRGSYTIPRMDSGRYYLLLYIHGSSNSNGIIRIRNVWLSSD